MRGPRAVVAASVVLLVAASVAAQDIGIPWPPIGNSSSTTDVSVSGTDSGPSESSGPTEPSVSGSDSDPGTIPSTDSSSSTTPPTSSETSPSSTPEQPSPTPEPTTPTPEPTQPTTPPETTLVPPTTTTTTEDPATETPTEDPATQTTEDTPAESTTDSTTTEETTDDSSDTESESTSDTTSSDTSVESSSKQHSDTDSESQTESKSTPDSANGSHEERSDGLSSGAIAGIAVAVLLGLVACIIGYFLWRRRQRNQRFYNPNDFEAFPDFDPASNTNLHGEPMVGYEKSVQSREPFEPPMMGREPQSAYSESEMSGFHSPTAPASTRLYMGANAGQPGYSSYTYD
ncbi:hypothetical protein IW148_004337 [Coemansia sp. RSA 1199]|nr:hypothetical protein IW148_004337 [Coemansia sp. RSA 1199]